MAGVNTTMTQGENTTMMTPGQASPITNLRLSPLVAQEFQELDALCIPCDE